LRERINDGHTLRSFTDFARHRVPKHDASAVRITEQVLANARQVVRKTTRVKGIDVAAGVLVEQLRQPITAS